ncbi:unnamed protein product [Diatraea saccharalis]|uniref:Uncharacterized protein n=1 Tax=Diatraea saccharalis TaxID=40085 RepID=A0A9N9WHJ5_9NEOP|nr:unnamed protein product [Diatraea saccharalis]
MPMPFIEIVYQAEISRFEDPDFEEFALRNCCEESETRTKVIEEFRSMIIECAKCKPRRTDDVYLLKFLRCRKFNTRRAHKLVIFFSYFHVMACLYRVFQM